VIQYPVQPPFSSHFAKPASVPASLAYSPTDDNGSYAPTNPDPFVLSPILNLPPSFGSAYVGETFSCTLCANHDIPPPPGSGDGTLGPNQHTSAKTIRNVRVEAEMKTPNSAAVTKLELTPGSTTTPDDRNETGGGIDLHPGETLQKVVDFDLKEEGNHVLAVTVSYYEATDVSGRTRTFRKLYQFICKASLIVRTKPGSLPPAKDGSRRWVLEAQLENCSEDAIQLERVVLDLEPGLDCADCNWEASGSRKPVLQPGEVEQVCFVVGEVGPGKAVEEMDAGSGSGRIVLGVLGIGWRSEMGNRGFLSTGKLGTRQGARPRG
jgi:trafficking protein particle complex subunit 13